MNTPSFLSANDSRGAWGEELACSWFRERGFRVLRRNLRKRWLGEIDLLVAGQGRLHLVEVKTGHGDWDELACRVDEAKLSRLLHVIGRFLLEMQPQGELLQVDLFLIQVRSGRVRVRWMQDVLPPEFLLDPELPDA